LRDKSKLRFYRETNIYTYTKSERERLGDKKIIFNKVKRDIEIKPSVALVIHLIKKRAF